MVGVIILKALLTTCYKEYCLLIFKNANWRMSLALRLSMIVQVKNANEKKRKKSFMCQLFSIVFVSAGCVCESCLCVFDGVVSSEIRPQLPVVPVHFPSPAFGGIHMLSSQAGHCLTPRLLYNKSLLLHMWMSSATLRALSL